MDRDNGGLIGGGEEREEVAVRYPGLTFMLCVGRSGGWGARRDGAALRVGLGPVSLTFSARDMERMMDALVRLATHYKTAATLQSPPATDPPR